MPALSALPFAEALRPAIRGWRWWITELAGLLPGQSLLPFARSLLAEVFPDREGVTIVRLSRGEGERLREDTPLIDFAPANWQEMAALLAGRRTRVVLRFPMAHVLTLRFPKAARPHLRSAVPLQLADHTPLPLDHVLWAVLDSRLDGDKLLVRVAIAKRDVIDRINQGLLDHSRARPLILAEAEGGARVALQAGTGSSLPRPWAWAAGILISTPPLLLIVLQLSVWSAQARVAQLEQVVRPKLAAERHLRSNARLASDLSSLLASPAVTNLLETLADRLPASGHVLDLAGNEDRRLSGTRATTDPEAVREALGSNTKLIDVHLSETGKLEGGATRLHIEAHIQ